MRDTINEYIKSGLPIFPCASDKTPAANPLNPQYKIKWKEYQAEVDKDIDSYEYIGLKMGVGVDPFFCIDFDLKNTSYLNLFEDYLKDLELRTRVLHNKGIDVSLDLQKKVLIQCTKNAGYHIIFRVDNADGTKHLAMSPDNKVVIETRGTDAYIIIAPSKGYKVLSKNVRSFTDVPKINLEERYVLENIGYTYNKLPVEPYVIKINTPAYTSKPNGTTPWDDYNAQIDGVDLLCSVGWTIERESGDRIYMTRPNKSHGVSGNWHVGLRLFKNFSGNVPELPDDNKAFSAFAIYAFYFHNGDFTAAAKDIYTQGFGDRLQNEEDVKFDNVSEYVYSFNEAQEELEKYYKGEIEKGKSTGSQIIDRFFLFKKNEFYQIVGDTNIGKTYVMKFIIALAIRFAGWKVLVAAQENKPWDFIDDLLSFTNTKSGRSSYRSGDINYEKQINFLKSRVQFIRSKGKTIFEVLGIAKELNKKEHFDMILLDPLNGFSIDTSLKLGYGHEYHQHTASELLNFAEEEMTVFLNTHTIVSSQRGRKIEDRNGSNTKERRVPKATDAEHGGSYANKADNIIILDRDLDSEDPEGKNTTLFWSKKIRNKKLGGDTNPDNKPINLVFDAQEFGFYIMWDGIAEENPLKEKSFKDTIEQDYTEITGDIPF